ncbi:MAG: RICIN domain-containing protein [Chitinophagaceae bacterium]|nr:RICIN domain-containing protein [Chitinophagaceae bacterium]
MKQKNIIVTLLAIFVFQFANAQQPRQGRYYIRLANGQSLEAESNTYKNDGCQVQIWKQRFTLNQIWDIADAGDGKFYIKNVGANKNLDAHAGAVNNNGCKVQLWQVLPANINQKWIFQSAGSNRYTVRCAASATNKVLDVTNGAIGTGGAAVQLWDGAATANQVWTLEASYDKSVIAPNLVDLRGNSTPYRNQTLPSGERGGCTYFGSLSALEAAYKKRGFGELDLSEEFMAITSKMFGLHPYWSDITDAKARENQFAGTQGGGSVALLAQGMRIPKESAVGYGLYAVSDNWYFLDQLYTNNNNFTVWNRFPQIGTATYYGVTGYEEIKPITAESLEKALSLGYEIKICIDNGSHCIMLAGFDKTNPSDKKFIIKDNYGPVGDACNSKLDYYSYSNIGRFISAEYITDVRRPGTWKEINVVGRWDLTYAGWKGVLDFYRLPGLMQFVLNGDEARSRNGGTITDRRLGTFYDHTGNMHRVNGKVINTGTAVEIEFYIDGAKPNLRWDELSGRVFRYRLSADGNSMSGSHTDLDGRMFTGSAVRINPNPPAPAGERTVTITPASITTELCPSILAGGDREFGGGPSINVQVLLEKTVDEKGIDAVIYYTAAETTGDMSTAIGTFRKRVYTAPPNIRVTGVDAAYFESKVVNFRGRGAGSEFGACNEGQVETPPVSSGSSVSQIIVVGDTGGNDISSGGDCRCDTKIKSIRFIPIRIKVANR